MGFIWEICGSGDLSDWISDLSGSFHRSDDVIFATLALHALRKKHAGKDY